MDFVLASENKGGEARGEEEEGAGKEEASGRGSQEMEGGGPEETQRD